MTAEQLAQIILDHYDEGRHALYVALLEAQQEAVTDG